MNQKNINWWEFIWDEIVQKRPKSLSTSDWPEGFIIMDRNLGATSNDIYNKNSHGYHYQRWNNYWFLVGCDEKNKGNGLECSNPYLWSTFTRAVWKDEYLHNGYVWKNFIKLDLSTEEEIRNGERDYWENDEHYYWLWWWENDYYDFWKSGDLGLNLTNQSMKDRQGPCPDWWHVPSIWEWAKLTTYWAIDYQEKNETKLDFTDKFLLYQIFEDEAADDFIRKFKLPMAWYIDEDSGNLRIGWWDYWSSSPFWLHKIGDKDDYFAYAVDLDSSNSTYWGLVSNSNWSPRARWASVRCFKNEFKKSENQITEITSNNSNNQITVLKNTWTSENVINAADWFDNGNQSQVLGNWFTREYNNAFKFSYINWITTASSIKNAKMNSPLTRIAMAKMLSQYAINVLWKQSNTSKWIKKFSDVTAKQNSDYNNAVTLSYQLWIMWQWTDKFRPNDVVTRAEFATALSRMLYNTEDWKWSVKYYEPHLYKLAGEWIIKNLDPKRIELRWNVMLMLMRSAISVDEVNNIINDTIKAAEEKANKKVKLITDEGPFNWYPEFDVNYWSGYKWIKTCKDENGVLLYNQQWIDFVYLYQDENWKHTCTKDECMDDKWNFEKLMYNEKVNYWWDDKVARRFSCTQTWFFLYASKSSRLFEYGEIAGLFYNNYNDRIIYIDEKDNTYWYFWFIDFIDNSKNIWDEYSDKLFKIEKNFNDDKEKYFQHIKWYLDDLETAINKTKSTDIELYNEINGFYTNYDTVINYAEWLLMIIDKYLKQLNEIEKTIKFESWDYSSSAKIIKMINYLELLKKTVNEWEKRLDIIDDYMMKVSVRNWNYIFPEWWRENIERESHSLFDYVRNFRRKFNIYQKYLINYAKNYISKFLR